MVDLKSLVERNDKGVITLTKGNYDSFMNDRGITKQVRETLATAEKDFYAQMYGVMADDMSDKIDEAKKKGEKNLADIKSEFVASIPGGKIESKMFASKTYINQFGGGTVTKCGVFKLAVHKSTYLPKEAMSDNEKRIAEKLGV